MRVRERERYTHRFIGPTIMSLDATLNRGRRTGTSQEFGTDVLPSLPTRGAKFKRSGGCTKIGLNVEMSLTPNQSRWCPRVDPPRSRPENFRSRGPVSPAIPERPETACPENPAEGRRTLGSVAEPLCGRAATGEPL